MKVSAIIPVYNESRHIVKLIEQLYDHVDEIIIINDGSKDNTSRLLKNHSIVLIENKLNLGKGISCIKGARIAKGDILLFIDGDLQHDPKEAKLLLEPIFLREVDVSFGYRDLKQIPILRSLINKITNRIVNKLEINEIKDPLCGYRAIKKDIFDKLNFRTRGYQFELEFISEVIKNSAIYTNIPISTNYNNEKSSINVVDISKNIFFLCSQYINKKF